MIATVKQQLYQTHGDVVSIKEGGQRPAPHHMAHGEIHQRDQKADGDDESFFHLRGLCVLQHVVIVGSAASLCFLGAF